jgi:hypothetical protein
VRGEEQLRFATYPTPLQAELDRHNARMEHQCWNAQCECGSEKVRANCRCRVELTERMVKNDAN